MTAAPTVYPLAWPAGRPRAKWRKPGKFAADGKPITITVAMSRLQGEIDRLGAQHALVSSDVERRLDGGVRSGVKPHDPGVCLYFTLKGKPHAMACDVYSNVAQNIAALAAHIEATRAIERHGVATAAETLQAFQALPPPDPGQGVIPMGQAGAGRPWHEVLGLLPDADVDTVEAVYRRKARTAHPDNGGAAAEFAALTAARDQALKAIAARGA